MSLFHFSKFQRVTVPAAMAGAEGVQGLVAEGHAELGAEPRYILQWPNAEKLGENGIFVMLAGEVGQAELAKAQPPKMISELQAEERARAAFEMGRQTECAKSEFERELVILARAVKRKRTAKAKSKSKSKR